MLVYVGLLCSITVESTLYFHVVDSYCSTDDAGIYTDIFFFTKNESGHSITSSKFGQTA